jgi:hypothetical protein
MWGERKRREKSTYVKGEAVVDPEFKRAVENETRKPALDYRRRGPRNLTFLTLVSGEYCLLCFNELDENQQIHLKLCCQEKCPSEYSWR